MELLLKKRNMIYGICAIWIILFHIFRRISMPYIPVLTNVIGIGNLGVDIFFFFSGLCLGISAHKNNNLKKGWKIFYKRRFKRILIPYLIICIPFYLWSAAFEHTGSILRRAVLFFANITSVSFWIKGTQTTWFVYGIIVFYLLFPVLFRFVIEKEKKGILILLLCIILFAVATSFIPILSNSTIVWSRLPVFTIGIIVFKYMEAIDKVLLSRKKTILIISSIVFIIIGGIASFDEISKSFSLFPVIRYILYIPLALAVLFLLSLIKRNSKLLAWIGSLSLEVYLVHITMLHPLKYYGIMDVVGYWLYLILPVSSVLISWFIGWIEKKVIKEERKI